MTQLRRILGVSVALAAFNLCSDAFAQTRPPPPIGDGYWGDAGGGANAVPEFDPMVAGTIASIVAGGALILTRRRAG